MTSGNDLRDRIASVVERADSEASDGGFAIAMPDHAAQAIIDEFGLTNELSFRFEGRNGRYPLNRTEDIRTIGLYGPLEDAVIESRIVGKWEKHE